VEVEVEVETYHDTSLLGYGFTGVWLYWGMALLGYGFTGVWLYWGMAFFSGRTPTNHGAAGIRRTGA